MNQITGQQLRDEALEQVERNSSKAYQALLTNIIETLASTGEPFSASQVRALAGEPPAGSSTNTIGACFAKAVKSCLLTRVGWERSLFPSCHAHSNPTYVGTQTVTV
jgi:hypothetical protein